MDRPPVNKHIGPEDHKADVKDALPPPNWDDQLPTDDEGRPVDEYSDVPTPTEALAAEYGALKKESEDHQKDDTK